MRNEYALLPTATTASSAQAPDGYKVKTINFDHLRRPNSKKPLFAIISAIAAFALLLLYYRHSPRAPQSFIAVWENKRFGVRVQSDHSSSTGAEASGWQLFVPSKKQRPELNELQPTKSQLQISPACIDLWISRAEICPELREGILKDETVDISWTWVNASAPVWQLARTIYSSGNSSVNVGQIMSGLGANRHRNHNQLLYSFRSIIQSLGLERIGKFFFISADFPVISDTPASASDALLSKMRHTKMARVKQIPTWLKPQKQSQIEVIPPSELFKLHKSTPEEQKEWINQTLPIFNSLAVESQMSNLDTVSDTIFYVNDDMYTRNNFSAADFSTTIFGPVIRIQRDLLVGGRNSGFSASDREGEWPSMHYSSWLLDQRFGVRRRGYVVHVPKALSVPLLRETRQIWSDELKKTAESRFRGLNLEVHICFMYPNYVIEKHREALLWSLIVGSRLDQDSDGLLNQKERETLLQDLFKASTLPEADKNDTVAQIPIQFPARESIDYSSILNQLGLSPPERTRYIQTPVEGYAWGESSEDFKLWPGELYRSAEFSEKAASQNRIACTIEVNTCFGSSFFNSTEGENTEKLFKHIAFENPECGDCLLTAFLWDKGTSKGLDNFLPPTKIKNSITRKPTGVPWLGTGKKDWHDEDFSFKAVQARWEKDGYGDARHFATTLLMRYGHVYGDSPTVFAQMRNPTSTNNDLKYHLKTDTKAALIAINDDITSQDLVEETDNVLQEWHQSMWGEKTQFEV